MLDETSQRELYWCVNLHAKTFIPISKIKRTKKVIKELNNQNFKKVKYALEAHIISNFSEMQSICVSLQLSPVKGKTKYCIGKQ